MLRPQGEGVTDDVTMKIDRVGSVHSPVVQGKHRRELVILLSE